MCTFILILSQKEKCGGYGDIMKRNNIQELRWEKNISQEELARKARMSQSNLSRIENEYQDPTQSAMIAISKAFGLKVTEVFNLDYK